MAAEIPEVRLSTCQKPMPAIGLGTATPSPVELGAAKSSMIEAINAGYRHFDTAFLYESEKQLGEAIVEALRLGLIKSRDELFVTTKLGSTFADPDQVVPACKMSLQNLQLDYVDMYLIHLPLRLSEMPTKLPVDRVMIHPMDIKGVWQGMEECKKLGLTKGIGVSNFSCKKLQELLSIAIIPPAVNQVELNPFWQQKQLVEFCKAKGIHITAYSPLGAINTYWGDNRILKSDVLTNIAKARGKTTAQIALRWVFEQGVSLVAKSYNKERMKENLQIFDWSLTEEELQKISQIPQRKVVTFARLLGHHDIVLELDAEI